MKKKVNPDINKVSCVKPGGVVAESWCNTFAPFAGNPDPP
jgi:hypothetical protein